MYSEYDFGVEYQFDDGKHVVLVVGDTVYFWTDDQVIIDRETY